MILLKHFEPNELMLTVVYYLLLKPIDTKMYFIRGIEAIAIPFCSKLVESIKVQNYQRSPHHLTCYLRLPPRITNSQNYIQVKF